MSKVLIAEDEPALLESFGELVCELGHECLLARDGLEAIAAARAHRPDVVITDYMMPRATGVEVMRWVQADPQLRHARVLLMSAGRPPEVERQQAFRFLAKPVSLEEFERAVHEGISASAKEQETPHEHASPADLSEVGLAREEMLNWVSHEIKSPLSAAMTATQLALRKLRKGEPARALERHLVITARQLARMDDLVTSILHAAQLHEGRLQLDLESIDLRSWLRPIIAYWKDLAPEHEITLRDGRDLQVLGDPERLRQVLDNLLSNAVKYGGNAIQVEVEPRLHEVAIHVADQGPGIAPEHLKDMFKRFHRVPGQAGQGHGLGLYIASALAQLHGGSLSVRSEFGQGARFTLTLPRVGGPVRGALAPA